MPVKEKEITRIKWDTKKPLGTSNRYDDCLEWWRCQANMTPDNKRWAMWYPITQKRNSNKWIKKLMNRY